MRPHVKISNFCTGGLKIFIRSLLLAILKIFRYYLFYMNTFVFRFRIRCSKSIAKIIPIEAKAKTVENLTSVLDRSFGTLPDFPDVFLKRRRNSSSYL